MVSGVLVDQTARTAAAARAEAIRLGQRDALNSLFERIVLRADDELLPVLPDGEITALVQGFEVEDEKISSRRYLANLTFKFKSNDVRSLLKREGIPFTETVAKPILVLPVFAFGGTRVLWDDPNPWRQAWAIRARMDTGLLPFIVPFGDLEDLANINADQAIEGDEASLGRMAQRYRAEEVLVVHAAVGFEGGSETPTVQVVLRRFGALGERVIVEQFDGQRGDQIAELLQAVANAITIDLEEEWKALTLLDFSTQFRLEARVPLTGLEDWLVVRRLLNESAVVQKSQLQALTLSEARVVVDFVGNTQSVIVALAQRDLDLVYNENLWTLSLRKNKVIESAISNTGGDRIESVDDSLMGGEIEGEELDPRAIIDPLAHSGAIEWQLEEEGEDEYGLHPSIRSGDNYSSDSPAIFMPLPSAGIDGGGRAAGGNEYELREDGSP